MKVKVLTVTPMIGQSAVDKINYLIEKKNMRLTSASIDSAILEHGYLVLNFEEKVE